MGISVVGGTSLYWVGRPLFCGMCVGWDIFIGLDVLAGKFLYVGRLRFLLSTINLFFFNNLDWGPVPLFAPWKHCGQCG